jgi:predicted nucleic acid-binding protein
MIVLDTNVLSALMTPKLNPEPVAWLDKQPVTLVWTTAVNIFESRAGIRLLPAGKRRDGLDAALDTLVAQMLADRILPFDRAAAEAAAAIAGSRIAKGMNIGARDTQIAGIVVSRGASLATRNLKDFSDLKIGLLSPWEV